MSLWRLELLRMIRTHRWMILVGVYVFFGIAGPLTGRYLGQILARFGGEIVIEMPEPTPSDGIVQFLSNTTQLGLLTVVIVAASALAIDARVEVAAFLRTRVQHPRQLLWPRYAVVTATAVLALLLGTTTAWLLTVVLLGGLPAVEMIIGTLFGALYLAFVAAIVAFVGSWARGMVTTVFTSLAILIAVPMIGMLPPVEPWLPSHLVTAVAAMIEGAPAADHLRAAGVSLVAIPALLLLAGERLQRREL